MSVSDRPPILLALEDVSHSFDTLEVLRDLRMEVRKGEFVAVVGPSGCGKTTLLGLLGGHQEPCGGRVNRRGTTRTVHQQDGLFPWLTAAENIELGLAHLKGEKQRRPHLEDLLALVRLEEFAGHYPHQLSGGMRQRVELARALAGETDALLLDEPFCALDYQTRLRMRRELTRLLTERPRTAVLVTHDLEEAAELADRILVLTDRPARVRREIYVTAPRPRGPTHPAVAAAVAEMLRELGLDAAAGECAPGGERLLTPPVRRPAAGPEEVGGRE